MSTPVALIVTPNRDPQITAIPVPLRLADGHDLGKVCVPHTDSTYEPIASALEDLGRAFLLGAGGVAKQGFVKEQHRIFIHRSVGTAPDRFETCPYELGVHIV